MFFPLLRTPKTRPCRGQKPDQGHRHGLRPQSRSRAKAGLARQSRGAGREAFPTPIDSLASAWGQGCASPSPHPFLLAPGGALGAVRAAASGLALDSPRARWGGWGGKSKKPFTKGVNGVKFYTITPFTENKKMAEHQLSLLIPKAAQEARAELIDALKAAENPAAWMIFMEVVTRLMPEVLSPGRPSAEVIQRSVIGQLGFKSWSEMVEAPNGLAWNVSGWKAWRRAWAVVQEHPWLRAQPLTSSEVNTLARTFTPFPATAQELEKRQAEQKTTAEQSKSESLADLRYEVAARGEIIGALTRQLTESMQITGETAKELGSLQAQLDDSKRQIEIAGAEIERLRLVVDDLRGSSPATAKPETLTRWQHFLRSLGFGA